MEAYPEEYIEHNLPLVILSGLGEQQDDRLSTSSPDRQESGTKIQAGSPECEGERPQHLLQQLLRLDGTAQAWNASASPGPSGQMKFKMKAIGRTYNLPTMKAAPLPQSPSADGFQYQLHQPPRTELHSPLSPLSPGSPIYPDGVFTPLWFTRHQAQIPAVFIAFFKISAAGDSSSDEQIKTDINAIKTAFNRSGFKSKFAAVLISDRSILQAPDLEERLSSIRRLTGLDSKTGLFLMPPMSSQGEIATFVHSMITTLQPLCVEYYRDLTKHARRKKTRGRPPSVSSPLGAGSHVLSTPGWNVRYEVKQGAFAEFRQEMDVAERHYSAAIDELFNAEGIFEATASWSPRWEEARLLCDSLAIRVIRCQLWTSTTTGAAQSWSNYKARMKDLIDRRGKGSQTYGWDAWEARWSETMAQLIQRADLPALKAPLKAVEESSELASMQVYALPEKSISSLERIVPFHLLHHAGYWLNLAARCSRERLKKALTIPEEDHIPPGQSPASTVANRSRNYDCYLAPEPHEEYPNSNDETHNHIENIARLAVESTEKFQERSQPRMSELMKLDLAQDFMEAGRFDDSMQILEPLWKETTWRQEDWHDLLARLLILLHQCARQRGDAETLLATTYELLSVPAALSEDAVLDLSRSLQGLDAAPEEPISLTYQDEQRLSPVAVAFAFDGKETHVGEPLLCQVIVASRLNERAATIALSSLTLIIGFSRTIRLVHDVNMAKSDADVVELPDMIEAGDNVFEAKTDLTIHPKHRRIFNFHISFREAEVFRLRQVSTSIRTEHFTIEHTFTDEMLLRSSYIFIETGSGLKQRSLPYAETSTITILPKPPKAQILLHGLKKQYYTDELIQMGVEIVNNEAEAMEGEIGVHVRDDTGVEPLSFHWVEDGATPSTADEPSKTLAQPISTPFSQLETSKSYQTTLVIQAPSHTLSASVSIDVRYTLSSDKSTPLRKSFPLDLHISTPFEAKFNFGPLLYASPWPSYFDPGAGNTSDRPGGIPQFWRIDTQLHSLASEGVVLHKLNVTVDKVSGDSQATARDSEAVEKQTLASDATLGSTFEVLTQKYSLDDRRPTTVESTLAIIWSHDDDSPLVETRLPVPRLTLPVSEPRVLCTLAEETPDDVDAMLHYYIENPSTHFLTFALTMEASEDFAFSGPKYRTLSLAPLSRHRVDYKLSLHQQETATDSEGKWIWPSLQVIDSYYQKTLRVHPGGPDVKFDEKQNIGVWIEGQSD